MVRVLIVDDDVSVLQSMETLLVLLGHEPHTASTPDAVPELFARLRPDLLIHDLNMPGLDLDAQLARLREQHGFVPLVLFTGQHFDDTLFHRYRAIGRVEKPFDPASLGAELEALKTAADEARERQDRT